MAKRIDEALGEGTGIIFLRSMFLFENEERDERIIKDLDLITEGYQSVKEG